MASSSGIRTKARRIFHWMLASNRVFLNRWAKRLKAQSEFKSLRFLVRMIGSEETFTAFFFSEFDIFFRQYFRRRRFKRTSRRRRWWRRGPSSSCRSSRGRWCQNPCRISWTWTGWHVAKKYGYKCITCSNMWTIKLLQYTFRYKTSKFVIPMNAKLPKHFPILSKANLSNHCHSYANLTTNIVACSIWWKCSRVLVSSCSFGLLANRIFLHQIFTHYTLTQ